VVSFVRAQKFSTTKSLGKSLGAISSSFKISVTTQLLIPQVASVAEQLGVHVQQFSSTKKRYAHTTGGKVEGQNLWSL
jgi:hypothetical protein